MRIALYSEEAGVYIGSFVGLGFWTKLDPVSQNAVVTFESELEARDYMATWESGPGDVRFVEVEPDVLCPHHDDWRYASMDACERAGLPRWPLFKIVEADDGDGP